MRTTLLRESGQLILTGRDRFRALDVENLEKNVIPIVNSVSRNDLLWSRFIYKKMPIYGRLAVCFLKYLLPSDLSCSLLIEQTYTNTVISEVDTSESY